MSFVAFFFFPKPWLQSYNDSIFFLGRINSLQKTTSKWLCKWTNKELVSQQWQVLSKLTFHYRNPNKRRVDIMNWISFYSLSVTAQYFPSFSNCLIWSCPCRMWLPIYYKLHIYIVNTIICWLEHAAKMHTTTRSVTSVIHNTLS